MEFLKSLDKQRNDRVFSPRPRNTGGPSLSSGILVSDSLSYGVISYAVWREYFDA